MRRPSSDIYSEVASLVFFGKDSEMFDTGDPRVARGASTPGGIGRQFRVQYLQPTESWWRMYGSFCVRGEAEQCVDRLYRAGMSVRMVEYRTCPTAP